LNLADVEKVELSRGNVLVRPGDGVLTSRLAARVKVLASSPFGLKDNQQYLFILGTQEILGYVSLFEKKELYPGLEDWVAFRFKEPLCAGYLDRFVVRLPSPGVTLGGGKVFDPAFFAPARSESTIGLETLLLETPEAWIHYRSGKTFSLTAEELVKETLFSLEEFQTVLNRLKEQGKVEFSGGGWVRNDRLEAVSARLKKTIDDYHKNFPSRPGLRMAETGKLLELSEEEGFLVCEHIISKGEFKKQGPFISFVDFKPTLSGVQKATAEALLERLRFDRQNQAANGGTMQSDEEKEVLHFLVYSGQVVDVANDFFLPKSDFEKLAGEVKELIRKEGKATAGRVRDVLGSSRKLVIPFLEKLDALGITRRMGDERFLAE
jgi:selenocysteine-specific elongation factor